VTTYGGTTGVFSSDKSGAAGTSAGAIGDRSRSMDTIDGGSDMNSVRNTYRDCKVTSATSSFALMSKGQLYMIDDTSGSLRQKMSSNPGGSSNDFHTVTVMGTPQGERLSVTSVQ
jgi:hypothetical protein